MCEICTMAAKLKANEKYNRVYDRTYKHTDRLKEAEAKSLCLIDYMRGKERWGSLHGHSEKSLLDGGAKIEDIFLKAKQMGQDFVAITDHGNLFAAAQAHQIAQKVGVKHIVGSELYLTPFGMSMSEKTFKKGETYAHHLVVLAKNKVGYQNLCHLSSISWEQGFYRNPRIDREALAAHKEGLIVTTSCVGGSVPSNAYEGRFYEADSDFNWFGETFGDDFYIEIQNHGIEIEKVAFEYMRELAQRHNVKMIATPDSHYLNKEDDVAHDTLLCIGTGQKVDQDERTFKFTGSGYHYMAEEEIEELFPHDKEAIYETGRVADKIEDTVIEFGEIKLPEFDIPTEDPDYKAWKENGGVNKWL